MLKKLYVGIDIGKDSLVATLCMAAGEQIGKSESFSNDTAGFKNLIRFVKARSSNCKIHCITEATGVYGLKMVDYFLAKTNWTVSVLNPIQVKNFIKSQMGRTKTDHTDSFYMAQYGFAFNPRPFRPAPPEFRELESIMSAVFGCKTRARQAKNRLHHYQLRPHQNKEIVALMERQIAQDEKDIEIGLVAAESLAAKHPGIQKGIDLLCTIPGVGEYSAFFFLPRLVMLVPLFDDCRKFLSYCGLVPEEKQSGTSINFRPKLSRKGNPWLRSAAYYPALTAARINPAFKEIYEKCRQRGKTKKQAVIFCMGKILRTCWGVFRSGKPYDEQMVIRK